MAIVQRDDQRAVFWGTVPQSENTKCAEQVCGKWNLNTNICSRLEFHRIPLPIDVLVKAKMSNATGTNSARFANFARTP